MDMRLVLIQKRGQLTVPADLRRKYGLEQGSVVAVIDEQDGIKLTPQEVMPADLLERIDRVLSQQGTSLEELMAERPGSPRGSSMEGHQRQ